MSDYQRTVEFLRDFRTSGVQVVTDRVRDAAAAYAALCATANDRLRQCAVLLQRGLRGEAVHLAEAAPNLLDLVAALDLPDPQGWVELCQRADLPVPQPLQMERATQLLDAYGQDQPVAHLYAIHRRLALSRGPILKRLDVMRQLSVADPSPVWDRDIRVFEQARFKELRVGFATAMRDRDVPAVNQLSSEVLQTSWVEAVPPDLAAAARDVDDRTRQAQAAAEVAQLLGKLRGAFAAKSLPDCTSLLTQLKEMSGKWNGAGMTEQTAGEVRSVMAWIQQENQALAERKAFEKACDGLKRALDAEVPDGELHAAFAAANASGTPLPAGLQSRYQAAIAARARAARWRTVGWLSGVAALLAIGLGIFYWRIQVGVAREWSRRIDQAVRDGNVDLADQLIGEQERRAPKASGSTEVVAAKQAVAVLREQTQRDRELITELLRKGERASELEAAALLDAAPPDQWWAAVAEADEILARTAKFQDPGHVDRDGHLRGLMKRLRTQRDAVQRRGSTWAMAQIDDASRKADVNSLLPRLPIITAAQSDLDAAERELNAVRPYLDRCAPEVRAAAETATPKLLKGREVVRVARAEWEACGALASSARSVASARQALQQFNAEYPNSTLVADFSRAAVSADLYESVERWTALAAPWATAPVPHNEKAVAQRLESLQAFLRDNPQCPFTNAIVAYVDYLKQAASALATPNAWQQGMGEILAAPLMSDLSMLEASDRTRYYVLGDPGVRTQGLGDRTRTVFDSIDPQNLARKRVVTLAPPRTLTSDKPTLVPHALVVRELVEQMKTVDDRNWETWGIDLVDRLAADEKMDPVVRAILLREAMQATATVDGWALSDFYERSLGELGRQRLDLVVWYDADHPVPPTTLSSLKAIVAKVPRGAAARTLVQARRQEVCKVLQPGITGMGMLLQDDDGKWRIVTPPSTPLAQLAFAVIGSLEAIHPPAPPQPAVTPQPPASSQPTTAAASQPTTAASPATESPPAPPLPPPPAPPAVPARMIKVATRSGNALIVDPAAVGNLPQGTLVLLVQP